MKHLIITVLLSLSCMITIAQREEYTWDYITFEEPYKFLSIDSGDSNIWTIGGQEKPNLFPYAGSNAMFTGGGDNYLQAFSGKVGRQSAVRAFLSQVVQ